MKYLSYKAGFTVKEVPIQFIERQYGVSKMHLGIIREAIVGVLQLRLSSFFKVKRVNAKSAVHSKP